MPMVEVSVLTPSFGYGRFIRDCIVSVIEQQGVSVEHIVQDGASSDETIEVLEHFDGVVRWKSVPDLGQSDALNKALSRAGGRWIAWLNADEFYLPGALEFLVEIGDRSSADVVYGESVFVDESGVFQRLLPQHGFSKKILREFGCYIASSSVLIRRSILQDTPWDPKIIRRMDWDLYMTLAAEGARFIHVPRPIGAFRIHREQVTAAPPTDFFDEDAVLANRHGLPEDPYVRWRHSRLGRWSHPARKFLSGAYLRQRRVAALRGQDLRWFRQDVGREATDLLIDRASGRRRH